MTTATPKEKLTAYFALFDGSPRVWEKDIAPEVNKIYHPDLVAVTSDGQIGDRDAIVAFVKEFTIGGGKVEDFSIIDDTNTAEGKVHYKAQLVSGDGIDSFLDNVGTFKDGLLIRIEPADPDAYSRMLKRHTNPST